MKKIYAILFVVLFSFATNINSFSQIIVKNNGGSPSAAQASLTAALALVGTGVYTGNVTVEIDPTLLGGASVIATTATIANSAFLTCKIYPVVGAVTLTANALAGNVIFLNGADNVTIDGRLNGVDVIGNGNSLSITSTNVGGGVRVVQVSNGSQGFTIRNVNITIPSPVTAATYGRCVNIAQSTTAAQGGQDNATVKYCNLSGGDRTLQTFGSSNVSPGPGIVANYNTVIFGNKVRNFSSLGIFLGTDVIDVTCDSNNVYDDILVYKGGAAGTSCRAIAMQSHGNVLIQNNIIHDLADNGVRATGMSLQGIITIPVISFAPIPNPVTTVTVQNNIVRLAQPNAKVTSMYGIYIGTTAIPNSLDYNARVYNNSAILGGTGTLVEDTRALIFDVQDATSVNSPSTAVYYNNVSLNLREGIAGSQHVGMDFEVETNVANTSDYNTCYSDGTTGTHFDAVDAAFGYTSTFGWRNANCALGNEQNSAMHPVNYDINYQLTTNYGDLNGKVLASVPKDIFGTTRAGTYPYRGAVEGSALKVLTVTMGLEGRTGADPSNVIVALYDGTCTFVDYACGYITDTDNSPKFIFASAVTNGPTYSLQCLTATHMVSWSAGTVTFSGSPSTASYVFNSAASIFGSNGTASGEFFAADVNQDETVDAGDLGLIDNDATLGIFECRLNTDVTYDGGADASDLAIADGNSAVGIFSSNKCAPSASVSKLISMNKENGKVKLSNEVKPGLKNEIGF